MFAYGRENLALVQILIQKPYYTKYKRDVDMTLTTYIANAGGLLGLWLGFSFLSAIEIIYWAIRFTTGHFLKVKWSRTKPVLPY